jgi:hypothetical protein
LHHSCACTTAAHAPLEAPLEAPQLRLHVISQFSFINTYQYLCSVPLFLLYVRLTQALNQLCLHVTKYMEFSNVLVGEPDVAS